MPAAAANIRAAATLREKAAEITLASMAYMLKADPDYHGGLDERGQDHCNEDSRFHLDYLAQAVAVGCPELFLHYIEWVQTVLTSYHVPPGDLLQQLESYTHVVPEHITEPGLSDTIVAVVRSALAIQFDPNNPEQGANEPVKLSHLARAYLERVLIHNRQEAMDLLSAALASGISLTSIYLDVIQPVQHEIGRLWQTNRISVAQEHYSTSLAQIVLSQLYSENKLAQPRNRTAVAACVSHEQHELGLRMVADFFQMDGWESVYLGPNTPTSAVISTIKRLQPHVLALSATLTPHLEQLKQLITQARQADIPHMKILVGGYPFKIAPDLWKTIGADACAHDAAQAVALANEMFDGAAG